MNRYIMIFCIVLLFLGCSNKKQIGCTLQCQAIQAFENKNYLDSIKMLKRVLNQHPNSGAAHYHLALNYAETQQFDLAKKHYIQAIFINPKDADSYNNMALLELAADNFELAEKYIANALDIYPKSAQFIYNSGLIQHNMKRFPTAIKLYKRTLFIDQNMYLAHFNLGNSYKRQGYRALAAEHFLKALKLNPNDWRVNYNAARNYHEMGDLISALPFYESALKLNPQYHDIAINLQNAKKGAVFIDKFIASLENQNLNDIEKADKYKESGLIHHAEKLYVRALKEGYDRMGISEKLAEVYLSQGRFVKSRFYYEQLLNEGLESETVMAGVTLLNSKEKASLSKKVSK